MKYMFLGSLVLRTIGAQKTKAEENMHILLGLHENTIRSQKPKRVNKYANQLLDHFNKTVPLNSLVGLLGRAPSMAPT